MKLEQINIVLCHPDESRNIGSACRAMANNDIYNLRIVGKKEDYNEEQVKTLSIHAFSIWQNAKFYDSLENAVSDCIIAAGTTRRRGKKRKDFLLFPEEFTKSIEKVDNGNIALIFGNERTGLTDEELEVCTVGINIPSSETFGSLNLSHAVQLICYSLFRSVSKYSAGYTPIDLNRINDTVKSITDNLQEIGFFSLNGRPDMEHFWTSLISRANLSEGEAQYLEKLFTKAKVLSKKK